VIEQHICMVGNVSCYGNRAVGWQHTKVLEAFGGTSRFALDGNLECYACSMCIDTTEHLTKDCLGLEKTIDLPFPIGGPSLLL
jgi:hypothetical protein